MTHVPAHAASPRPAHAVPAAPTRPASATPAAIEADSLVVRLKRTEVLHGLGFSVPEARVTGLLGPSGSGKSTLMRTIMGVQRIASGTLRVLDRDAGSAALRPEIGYMTQDAAVYNDLTVLDNVRYFAALHGKSRSDAREAVDAVGLSGLEKRKAVDLSGGQFSRVSLACALVGEPKLLVLDEPTVGLDPVLRVDLWERFRALADHGTTLLVSSHVMEEASRCDSLLLLREGNLLAQLTPDELRERGRSQDLEQAFLGIIQGAATRRESVA